MATSNTFRITANLPEKLRDPIRQDVREGHYPSDSAYGVGLILWDVYSRQPHLLTGPVMRGAQWEIDAFADGIAKDRGVPDSEGLLRTYRFTCTVPAVLRAPVAVRIREERYKGNSAYLTALIFFALKVRDGKKVPHHYTSPVMREPDWIRDQVIAQLVADFGNPDRKWPKGIVGRITQLIQENQEKRA